MRASGILQIANKPGFWLVPSADGQRTHEVHGRTLACDCQDFRFRREGTADRCRHGKALKAHLESLAACPQCGGRGFYLARFQAYASGSDPIPCATCDGSGRRETADPRLAAMWDREHAAANEQALKDMFR